MARDHDFIFRSESKPDAMRLHTEGNAHYLRFAETPVIESEEARAGIVFDFDANGRIFAIEILDI